MADRNEVMRKIFDTVGRSKSVSVIDRALQIFDAVVQGKPIPAPALTGNTIKSTQEIITMGTEKAEKPRQPWFQNNRYFDPNAKPTTPAAAPQRTAAATPAPTIAQNLRASRTDLSQMNGHEMAFVKQGGDLSKLPQGTDLTRMDKGQMASLAHSQTLKATEPMFRASGKLYRR